MLQSEVFDEFKNWCDNKGYADFKFRKPRLSYTYVKEAMRKRCIIVNAYSSRKQYPVNGRTQTLCAHYLVGMDWSKFHPEVNQF